MPAERTDEEFCSYRALSTISSCTIVDLVSLAVLFQDLVSVLPQEFVGIMRQVVLLMNSTVIESNWTVFLITICRAYCL